MWKNIVKPDRPQMTIWRRSIAWWVTKATNALSEFVILSAFPLTQWLNERASILRYTYIACLVNTLNPYHVLHSKRNSYFVDSEDWSLFRYYVKYTGTLRHFERSQYLHLHSQAVQIEEEVFYQTAKPNITEDLKSREIKNPHLCMLRAYISINSTNYFDKLRKNNLAHKTKMRIYIF